MHTMGLAFDIALVNTPIARVQEIRRVLQEMRAAGDILFIGERQQLVFHVVPHPSRLGYFSDIYAQAVGAVSAAQSVEVVAPGPLRWAPLPERPRVVTDIVAIAPLSSEWAAWSAALAADARAAEEAVEGAAATATATAPLAAMVVWRGLLAFLAAFVASFWRIARRSRAYTEA
jgi:hypothetical protein